MPLRTKTSALFSLSALISPPLLPFICLIFSLDARDFEKRRATTRGLIHEVFNVNGFNFFGVDSSQ